MASIALVLDAELVVELIRVLLDLNAAVTVELGAGEAGRSAPRGSQLQDDKAPRISARVKRFRSV